MRIKAVTLGFVLAGTALGSGALTLGRARGAAWIGQPLDLIVPVQVDPGQTDAALCAEADVFHGDSRQDGNRVQVQVSPSDQPETFNLKIASSALIDEPVVTIYLRAGCTQKFSRKYVLLADFPSELAAPLSRTTAQTATPLPVLVPAEAVQARQAPSTTSPGNATPAEPPAASRKVVKPTLKGPTKDPAKTVVAPVAKQSAPQKESPNKVEKPADSPVISSKPRLRLDPVETLSERVKSLESTTTGTTRSEEVARDIQRMELLQSDMKVLLEQAVKNEASLVAMRERLERAESDRVPVAAVYGLGALVLLCLGALALMWSKRPKNGAWGNSATKVTQSAKKLPSSAINEQSDGEEQDFEVNAEDIDKASFDALVADQAEAPKEKSVSKFIEKASVTKTVRSDYNADHQVDLRQQAEFLAKLGKVDEALQILKDGIRDNPKESPLLFLDLLGIANNFNRNSDFNMYREQMISLFNVKIPESALTNDEGRSLDDNPALLEHINSQWKSPHVLDVIEACIMRDPDAKESDPFDLAAFRELLNMHSVANEHHNAAKGA